jgi:CBS domain-containing protein
MRVGDLPPRELETVAPQSSLSEAAQLMSSTGARCLLVVSGGRRTGIMTAGDLVRSIAAGTDPN